MSRWANESRYPPALSLAVIARGPLRRAAEQGSVGWYDARYARARPVQLTEAPCSRSTESSRLATTGAGPSISNRPYARRWAGSSSSPGESPLDVGCGTGVLLEAFSASVPDAEVPSNPRTGWSRGRPNRSIQDQLVGGPDDRRRPEGRWSTQRCGWCQGRLSERS